jgi:hypothetical protein
MDRIYALVGFFKSENGARRLIVDYGQPLQNLYLQFTLDYVNHTESLLPLSFSSQKNKCPDLPTWAIGWTRFTRDCRERCHFWRLVLEQFKWLGNIKTTYARTYKRTLSARGHIIDQIVAVGEVMNVFEIGGWSERLVNWKRNGHGSL